MTMKFWLRLILTIRRHSGETLDWFKNFYTLREEGKFRFPTYGYISEDEQTYGKDVENRMVEFVYTVICCPTADF